MIKKYSSKKIKHKKTRRLRNLFKNDKYFLNKKSNLFFYKEKINYMIDIKITPNNMFCCLKTGNSTKQTLILLSAGILKLNISKKKLKFASKYIMQKFLKNLRIIRKKYIFLNVKGPAKIKKYIVKQIITSLKHSKLLINICENKSFNGCRPKKIKRKKRKGFRILK
jgi:ribosomal protein S11